MHGRGAKTLNLENYRITTVSKMPVFRSCLSRYARHVRNLFFKSAQKVGQKVIPTQKNLQSLVQLWPLFEQFFRNQLFKTSLLNGMCPTLICRMIKLAKIRSDGRTVHRILTTWRRKERFGPQGTPGSEAALQSIKPTKEQLVLLLCQRKDKWIFAVRPHVWLNFLGEILPC